MAEKTLSAGTLGLRFMQGARRAHAEPEHAPVADDGAWALPPAHRQPPMAYRGEKAVTYETSYLPFLFPSLHDTPSADTPSSLSPPDALRPRGRRAFNKRGQEITHQSSPPTTDPAPRQNIDHQPAEPSPPRRLHSISSTIAARKPNREPSRTAKDAIFDTSRVGTDLGRASIQASPFLRPAGVDGPADPAMASGPSQTAPGAPRPSVKRSHTSGQADRPQKQTKLGLIE